MKLVIAWLVLVGFAVVTAGSCSISHVSGEYTCGTSADCQGPAAGRICSGGFCVAPGGPQMDAPAMLHDGPTILPDAATCPSQCTSCDIGAMTCNILCNNSGNCANEVDCPVGYHCTITCGPGGSCRTVNCLNAGSCDVTCTGTGSCRQVSCGPTACNVSCTGAESCRGVACGTSCACDVTCGNLASCQAVFCSHQLCDTVDGCSSAQDPSCSTCP